MFDKIKYVRRNMYSIVYASANLHWAIIDVRLFSFKKELPRLHKPNLATFSFSHVSIIDFVI
jgi:hypothetical protein